MRSEVLNSLTGLEGITSLPGALEISFSNALSDLTGLDNVASIGGELRINNNASLTTLTGLEALTSIGECLTIKSNTSLNDLEGLNNINSIGACFSYGAGRNNNSSSSIAITIGGNYSYEGNGSLYDLCALSSLIASVEVSESEVLIGNNLYNPTYLEVQDNVTCANATLSVDESIYEELNIYPNPVTEVLNIKIPDSASLNPNSTSFEIYDVTGKLVMNIEDVLNNKINVSELNTGVYFYILKASNSIVTNGKIVKE